MKKISKTKVANTYAMALLETALDKKVLNKVFDDVLKIKSVLAQDAGFVGFMTNPMYSDDDKSKALSEVVKKTKISTVSAQFLDVLRQNRRLCYLDIISDEFVHLYYKHNDIAEVEVESVKALSAGQNKKMLAVLEKQLGKKAVVTCSINPELIGGLRVRVGSKMFDDSVVTKLNHLEIMMKGEE
ncbi:MAG: ATP synthase F1 subunit delta [Alphaproteobacteria bacterium]|nr:ATP synthase F1 subunit delta [Alphaproteobacteria bacterium]